MWSIIIIFTRIYIFMEKFPYLGTDATDRKTNVIFVFTVPRNFEKKFEKFVISEHENHKYILCEKNFFEIF